MDRLLKRVAHGPVITLAAGLIICVIILVQATALLKSREDTWDEANRSAENVLRTLATTIERNFDVIELSMAGVHDALALPDLAAMPAALRQQLLFDRTVSTQFLDSLVVLDAEGHIVFDSGSPVPRKGSFADRDYFLAQHYRDAGTFLSAPYISRLREGDPSIALSRRITAPDGTFKGVILASVRIAFFKTLFKKVNLGHESTISLLRTDGVMVYRQPSTDDAGNVGTDVSQSETVRKLLAMPNQPFAERSGLDGVRRFFVHQRIGRYPLILVVGFSIQSVFTEWNTLALVLSLLTLGMCALLALLVQVLKRALVRSYEMDEQLKQMAVTDVLTQMPNRRALDMALDTEMRRAAREKTKLSVLLIDIDYFKRVNDSYGHEFGDQMLRLVARQVVRSIRRPGDFAARYGGEEFVVILPSTDEAGAAFIAERIRTSIAEASLTTESGQKVIITASVGTATGRITSDAPNSALLRKADEALYAAKRTGRNRVVGAEKLTESAAGP